MSVLVPSQTGSAASYALLSPQQQVAFACRILASEGFSDLTLGHASVRPPSSAEIFIKRKGPALQEVNPEDVVAVDYRSDAALEAPGLHLETAMHTAVYRARADVGAVIHAHPPYATALGACDARLEFLTHDAALFAEDFPQAKPARWSSVYLQGLLRAGHETIPEKLISGRNRLPGNQLKSCALREQHGIARHRREC